MSEIAKPNQTARRRARHPTPEREMLESGVFACALGATIAAALGALAAVVGLLPMDILPASVLVGMLGAAAGVLVATWRALFLETPSAATRHAEDDDERAHAAPDSRGSQAVDGSAATTVHNPRTGDREASADSQRLR